MSDTRSKVQAKLKALASQSTKEAATELFGALGYASRKTVDLDGAPASFLEFVVRDGGLAAKREAQVEKWQRVNFLFQLTNDEIPILSQGNRDLSAGQQDYRTSIIESFVFLTIELVDEEWSRSALAGITREVNRLFPMPAVILFKHGKLASLAVIDRRPNKKDGSRDVVEKRISIVKDINLASPHRAHVDILCDIALSAVKVRGRGTPTNFRDLYDGWIEALSAQTLNTRFYRELANWFFWSTKIVEFPSAVRARENETTERAKKEAFEAQNQIAVIRLLTRLIFVWFIKEKGLVPEALFDAAELKALLNEEPASRRDSSTYYKAVLQNLFFATLNTEMSEDRKWRTKGSGGGLDGQYLIHTVYRFRDAFRDPDKALGLFKQVPFLNGGLFECLDREVTARDLERNPDLKKRLVKEGSRDVIRIDGFSERSDNKLKVPNKIFFATKERVDLNEEYDTKGKTYEADGLIELFSRYKFTVEENTPVEEEVALDPELLGKVFENLLASYNADTRTTARKKSGSFYTPREVVDYMVDEALVAYFEQRLAEKSASSLRKRDLGPRLRNLLSFKESGNPFSNAETDQLIAAIDNLKALDPACGSGAFPMGLLQKLIHVLHRLDPDNARWKAQNRKPLEARLAAAKQTPDPSRREAEIEEAEAALAKLDRDFSDANKPDYARKLYLIDKCLFGVDIQPIAVQIAKLRFFISLVVSQKIDRGEDNANITALPNLETKLVAANSLIPIERKAQADLFRNTKIAEKEAELRAMNARYFSARTAKTKRLRREDIARLRDQLAELLKSDRGLPETDAKLMAAWDPFDQNAAAPFFDPEWMFGLSSRFDLVIGNPPYVRQEAIKDQKPALEKHYGGKDKKGNPLGAYAGTADLFVYFIQRGIELLNPGGAFAYITSNKWYRAKYGANLRGWLNRQTELRRIVDFGDAEVFDAIAYPTIIIATRRDAPVQQPDAKDSLRVMNWPQDLTRDDIPGFPKLVDEIGFDMPQKALAADGWQLEPQARRGLLDRIRAAGMPLGQYVEGRFYYGIKTGFNDAFVIDGPTKDRLIAEHASSAEIIKPFLRGRDIKRWRVEPQDLWLIFTRRGIDIDAYPAIKRHLEGYRDKLEPKPVDWDEDENGKWEGRKAGSYKWFEIQDNIAYWHEFDAPKIVVPAIQNKVDYAPDLAGFYSNDKTSIIVDERWTYLLAVLNSPVSWWLTQQAFASKQGGFYEFKPMYVAQVPIPSSSERKRELMDGPVKAIVAGASDNRLEQLLNGFVYELFFKDDLHARGLTLFDEAERAGLGKLAGLEGSGLVKAAESFAATHLVPGARLRTMLSDLATLDVVRIIEGRE
ncbi:MAG TPA: Eco57I restriction-modification methylase domain-containing protein [Accumulibacter sp.]|uniref:Eco57I restriction-modification methylase domain-containing protein n=1 Tax=Accumulibacter sp. TaxID=2053492 RepID=UPI002B58B4EF|nr:Eco57I restriction-modification methylase domain-containing protein [Accumulibacter sp.]HRD87323.1 Eco57I restriction-modification methylase domain-containing protein [Accumulibacter sp.]